MDQATDWDEVDSTETSDLMAEEIFYPDDLTKFVFEEPGVLVVDASHGHAAFPVPAQPLVFATRGDFLQFMQDTFNARVYFDPVSGEQVHELDVVTVGIPYVTDSAGTKLIPVDRPVETFLGGPYGYYVVEGKVRCIDPTLCALECLPMDSSTTMSVVMPTASNTTASSSSSPSSVTPPFPGPFSVRGLTEQEPTSGVLASAPNAITFTVITEQKGGQLPYESKADGPPTQIGDIVRPSVVSTKVDVQNKLSLEFWLVRTNYDNFCRLDWSGNSIRRTETNVPRLTYVFERRATTDAMIGGTQSVHEVFNYSIGGGYKWTHHCRGAGCYTDDPCRTAP